MWKRRNLSLRQSVLRKEAENMSNVNSYNEVMRELLWSYRLWRCLRLSESYGQFLSCVGFEIAHGRLPQDILGRG